LNIDIRNFKLEDISRIVEKDTSLVKGTMSGNVLLKKVADSYGLVSDIRINSLVVRKVPIGDLSMKAENPNGDNFAINVNLTGPDNNMTVAGNFVPGEQAGSFDINTDIQSLSMKTIEAFSMDQITEAEGTLTGNFLINGTTASPQITGNLTFNNVFMKPAYLNNRLEIKEETIELRNDGIYFDTFTLADASQHTAVIDGSVQMKQFSDFIFALQVNTTDFLLFNTAAKDNQNFFGRMIIDSKIDVTGPMELPRINARVKMKEGSNFTFSVPEDQLTTDKGEDVVIFLNPVELSPILTRGDSTTKKTSGMTGFDLASIIEIDKGATLRLLMDPASADSLVVRGEAALSFTMDQSGKMSLTGSYNLSEGSYLVSFESVIKRKFDIESGSTITWNGDPMDALISINAIYTVRTSPADLMADQATGNGGTEVNGNNGRYPFQVLLKLRGEILKPEISFEIQIPTEEKGKVDEAVINKISMLNEDESALNKQVFALLVLGRFIQENPFESEAAGGTSTMIRSTVSKFLSAQLNQLSSKMLPGTEINFDIQSYDENVAGGAQGRTDVEFGVKQQLFNERLSVEIGGSVNVEGDQGPQDNASEIASDVTVEYKLTKDGRFRMKGFRLNQYEALEGQIIETGIGVVYVKDFNRWNRLFKGRRNRSDSLNNQNTNDTSDSK
ncbi:MAG: translocation/assembly module TamB, partial [Verrucomicrobia bacterium]|nr:translocation/assembly module TamB [Prolixibacteraceae bacterium]